VQFAPAAAAAAELALEQQRLAQQRTLAEASAAGRRDGARPGRCLQASVGRLTALVEGRESARRQAIAKASRQAGACGRRIRRAGIEDDRDVHAALAWQVTPRRSSRASSAPKGAYRRFTSSAVNLGQASGLSSAMLAQAGQANLDPHLLVQTPNL